MMAAMSVALLAGACAAGTSLEPAPFAAAVEPATTAPATTMTEGVPAGETATFAPPPVTYTQPDVVGITGAALPSLDVVSAEFDADRVLAGAGNFPPLDDPAVVGAKEATWLKDNTLVLGTVQNGAARAYPVYMMRFHHVSNDDLGGEPFLVTF